MAQEKPQGEENIRIHQPDRQIILSCKHKYEGMFPPPSHYLLLGYLALSSVAVPVHFAPGIPAIPSYNLLSLNEKACSYEWIWTWWDVKFIQNTRIQLSVSIAAAQKCLWIWSFEGNIFSVYAQTHLTEEKVIMDQPTHMYALMLHTQDHTRTHKQYMTLSSIKVICCWEITDPQMH